MLQVKINKGEHWDSKNNKLVQLFEIAKVKPDKVFNAQFG